MLSRPTVGRESRTSSIAASIASRLPAATSGTRILRSSMIILASTTGLPIFARRPLITWLSMGALIPRTSARNACETSNATTRRRTRSPSGSPYHSRCNAMFRWTILWSSTSSAPLNCFVPLARTPSVSILPSLSRARTRNPLFAPGRGVRGHLQCLSRLDDVVVDLRDQPGRVGEPHLVAQPRHEVDRHVLAVEVLVDVQDERLDGPLAPGERRVRAHRDRGAQPAGAVRRAGEPGTVDTVGRDGGEARRRQVRRRVAELVPPTVPADDDAFQAVRAAERLGRGDDVPGVDARPDVRARERDRRLVLFGQFLALQFGAVGGETEPAAEGAQQRDVTGGLGAEGEVVADDHRGRVQPVDEHLVHELLRLQPGQF